MKKCNKCYLDKELEDFHRNNAQKDGRYPTCKSCRNLHRFLTGVNRNYPRPPAYWTWTEMRRRCDKPKEKEAKYYKDAGVRYEPRWKSWELFWEDMGPTWKKGLSLDRINPYGDYSKENCRWATPLEQANNRRKGN